MTLNYNQKDHFSFYAFTGDYVFKLTVREYVMYVFYMHVSPKIDSNFSRSAVPGNYGHKQDAELSQRDRAAWCVIVFVRSRRTGRQYFADIVGLASTTVI